ncbi:hypothetical protein H4Q32_023005 [Labeo rohita]|uniref:Ig-like domain-containing protein n=1 Tax=Labeo rohita TaxID=84645 RepID=A0ABQ8MU32_LABRO|nr:hypothetical protein H4Q32_023005 [Labeo rohita]
MAEKCHLCLMGLIILSSLLTVTSGAYDAHMFISSGDSVRLPCNNVFPDRKSTHWIYHSHLAGAELIAGGEKKKGTEIHERLSLGSDCSLYIKNITKEDSGSYTCRQYVNDKQLGTDAQFLLHVLHVSSSSSSSSSQTEISPGSSVIRSCQLYSYSYDSVSCDVWKRSKGIQLFWVNQAGVELTISDSRYQILFSSGHCISTLNTTLLNEDDNRELRCEVTYRDRVQISATYTGKSSGSSGVDESHVFISSGKNVRLPCKIVLSHCKSTHWIYNRLRYSATVKLISGGEKEKNTERHERLSVGSDCSLSIKNVTKEDYGSYTCQKYVNGKKEGTDACVHLHVLHVSSSSSSQTEISPASSVTLSCQLYSFEGVSCDDWIRSEGIQLFWVNQAGVKLTISDSRYQESAPGHCISTLNTTLLKEDDNRELRCEVTHRDQVMTSATYTNRSSARADLKAAMISAHPTNSQDPPTTNTHKTTVPDLWIFTILEDTQKE